MVTTLGSNDQSPVPGINRPAMNAHPCAVFDLLEDFLPRVVDQDHTIGDKHLGAQVRVAARDRGRRIDHRRDASIDERIGRNAIEIAGVEDGDIAGSDATQQPVDVPIYLGGSDETRS